MTDAPETIWIDAWGGNWSPVAGGTQGIEYRRVDLADTPAQNVRDDPRVQQYEEAYQYALMLADVLHKKHYAENTGWRPLGDLVGLLTQIDNMIAGFVRPADPLDHPKVKALVEALVRIIDLTSHNMPMSARDEQCVNREARVALAALKADT